MSDTAQLSGSVRIATTGTVEVDTRFGLLRIPRNQLPTAEPGDLVLINLEVTHDD